MTPLEYINFQKEEIKHNCISVYELTEDQSEEILNSIVQYLKRFTEVRNSETKTELIVKEIIDGCDNWIVLHDNFLASKFECISYWLIKALWTSNDKSFYWSKVFLGIYSNRKKGTDYNVTSEYISPSELFEILRNENMENDNFVSSGDSQTMIQTPTKKENPYPQIFASIEAFELFERLHDAVQKKIENNKLKKDNQLVEYSFIYWKMIKDKQIYEEYKPVPFREVFLKKYDVYISDKLKTYESIGYLHLREENYSKTKDLLQLKSNKLS